MATQTQSVKVLNAEQIKRFSSTALYHVSQSLFDWIITIIVTGMATAYMMQTIHPALIKMTLGYYIAAMFVQLLIRITQKFDDTYTADELADLIIKLDEKLDRIERNV